MKRKTQRTHRRVWLVLGVLLPVVFVAAIYMKQSVPVERPAILIKPAGEQ